MKALVSVEVIMASIRNQVQRKQIGVVHEVRQRHSMCGYLQQVWGDDQ